MLFLLFFARPARAEQMNSMVRQFQTMTISSWLHHEEYGDAIIGFIEKESDSSNLKILDPDHTCNRFSMAALPTATRRGMEFDITATFCRKAVPSCSDCDSYNYRCTVRKKDIAGSKQRENHYSGDGATGIPCAKK